MRRHPSVVVCRVSCRVPCRLTLVVQGVLLSGESLGQRAESQVVERRVDSGLTSVHVEVAVRVQMSRVSCVVGLGLAQLESLGAAEEASVTEHVTTGWVESPVVAFSGASRSAGDLAEAVVEGEVVADGVLPALLVLLEVRESVHDESVDLVQSHHP